MFLFNDFDLQEIAKALFQTPQKTVVCRLGQEFEELSAKFPTEVIFDALTLKNNRQGRLDRSEFNNIQQRQELAKASFPTRFDATGTRDLRVARRTLRYFVNFS